MSLAGAQGFLTNIGGLVTMTVTIPANVSGLALLQAHMVGGIAHLRGYDLADPRVRNAVLACMLGGDSVTSLIKAKKLPSSPMAIATAPAYDPTSTSASPRRLPPSCSGESPASGPLATLGAKDAPGRRWRRAGLRRARDVPGRPLRREGAEGPGVTLPQRRPA